MPRTFWSEDFCSKCEELNNSVHTMFKSTVPFYKKADYIWEHGIKDMGLEWYKVARDKYIIKRDKEYEVRKKKNKVNRLKTADEINRW